MYKIKLSPYSKIFYLEWLLNPNGFKYNMSSGQLLHGQLDIERLKKAIYRYVSEHIILGSHIQNINNDLYWVKNSTIVGLEFYNVPPSEQDLLRHCKEPFDLHNGPLYKFKLFKINNTEYKFITIFHHLVVDGLSTDQGLFNTLSKYYNDNNYHIQYSIDTQISLIENLTVNLSNKLLINYNKYKDFWQKQIENLEGIDLRFLKTFKEFKQQQLQTDTYEIKENKFSFGDILLNKLSKLKHKYITTTYIYGVSIYAMLLHRYTGQKNFAICYPVAIKEGVEFIYGGQVNTSLIIYDFETHLTIVELINYTKNFFKLLKQDKLNHNYFPINEIVQENNKDLLNAFFSQANFKQNVFKFENIKIKPLEEFDFDSIDFLLLAQEEKHDKLTFRIRYDTSYFNKELLDNFIENFKFLFANIIDDLLSDNNKSIYDYSLTNLKDYQRVLCQFNETYKFYPSNKTIHQLFEEQVTKFPDNIAVTYKNIALTYKTLNEEANKLSNFLLKKCAIYPDNLIAFCLDRGEQVLISILAILKSGAAYVPIDPDHPKVRINHILSEINAKACLINESYKERFLEINSGYIILLDNPNFIKQITVQPSTNPCTIVANNNLAYVLYTSGSTGIPKGVMVEHESVVNLIYNMIPTLNLNHTTKTTQFANYVFDASVYEIFPILSTGGNLHILSQEVRNDPHKLLDYYKMQNITTAFLPTVLLKEISQFLDSTMLKIIYTGGENLNGLQWLPQKVKIINQFGPTETTVCATQMFINNLYDLRIGSPLANINCYVVDENTNILPIGAIGELLIGGSCVARGYFNDISLTEKKFINNPFKTNLDKKLNTNKKLFKTGDLVRLHFDGNLEFIGRKDLQTKIAGNRIELEEIEKVLSTYLGIQQAAVIITRNIGSKIIEIPYLVAYYSSSQNLNEQAIFDYLNQYLPQYMIPNTLIHLKSFPLTASNKINRKALVNNLLTKWNPYVAPTNNLELKICKLYKEILLSPNSVGINDDFFKLGGSSLLTIKLITKLQYSYSINVNDIYKLRTPAKIAKFISTSKSSLSQNIEKIKSMYSRLEFTITNDYIMNNMDDPVVSRYKRYLQASSAFEFDIQEDKISNILLTGATGHLGCNLLHKLLMTTPYTIYLTIRAGSQKLAFSRLNDIFYYYFNGDLSRYSERIVILVSNLENLYLGLNQLQYNMLINKIDSIIHCASLVKHYGDYDLFYKANVKSTVNLLELTKLTHSKDFHYISTLGVLLDGYIPNHDSYIFNENDLMEDLVHGDNTYAQSKREAELTIIKFREYGVKSNIYRLGNLLIDSTTGAYQKNFKENLAYSHIKAIWDIGIIPKELTKVEVSPVNDTALAILKLFNQTNLKNQTFHMFNSSLCNIYDTFCLLGKKQIKHSSMQEFVAMVLERVNVLNPTSESPELFMLYQLWTHEIKHKDVTIIKIADDKTRSILSKLGFLWPELKPTMMLHLLNNL